jgi:hypothetical protein
MSELRSITFEGIDCHCEFQCSLPQYERTRPTDPLVTIWE